MKETFTQNHSQSKLNESSTMVEPRKSTIDFIKQFARVYMFPNHNNELGSLILN